MKKASSSSEASKLDKKTVEKNRRIQMKDLCFKLVSTIPTHHFKPPKEMLSLQDQVDYAASYIGQLRERIEKLKGRKEEAMRLKGSSGNISPRLPLMDLKDLGSIIEVILISGLKKNFMLYEVISILEEEGAEVVSASFSTVGDKIFHTVHAQVKISRVGVETSSIRQRLQELISQHSMEDGS